MKPPQLNHRLTSLDATFLYLEKKECPLHIGSVSVFAGDITGAGLRQHIAARLHLLPRYVQKVVPDPFYVSHPTWETATDFSLERHIFERQLAAPGDEAALQALAGDIWSQLLDRNQPLWELHVVRGLADGRAALIAKVHHCMVDGVSGVDLMRILFDISPHATPPPPPKPDDAPKPLPDPTRQLFDALIGGMQDTMNRWVELQGGLMYVAQNLLNPQMLPAVSHLARMLPAITSPPTLLPFNGTCSGRQHIAWSEFSFADARAIRTACDGTVNDVVLTVLSGAVSRYAVLHGQPVAGRSVRFMVPVSLRQKEQRGALGNLISILPVEIPLDIADPLARFQVVKQQTAMMKAARLAEGLGALGALYSMLPAPLQQLVGALAETPVPPFNMVATNVPGPQVPLYMLGQKMLAHYPYVPIGYAIGVGCAILTYDQKIFFGLSADSQIVPDIAQFKQLLDECYAELRARAGVPEPDAPPLAAPPPKVPKRKARAIRK